LNRLSWKRIGKLRIVCKIFIRQSE
jgi:hypothetical protein